MALQKTAHDACSRKVHCVKKGYLDDEFVEFFSRDTTIVNSPLMNRGTWLRTTAIEKTVIKFSQRHENKPIQIISYGAGIDTLYFQLMKKYPELKLERFVEIDLPSLVLEKHTKIAQYKQLSALVTSNYRLIAADIQNLEEVREKLEKNAVSKIPTIILGEMVFVYLEEPVTTKLLDYTVNEFLGGTDIPICLITYDAINPNDRFGSTMCTNLQNFGADLKGIAALPTPEAHSERARRIGFRSVEAMTMRALYLTVPKELQAAFNKLEMIDDWDEWNLMLDHYCFMVASTEETLLNIF